jgi:flagellar biosynthesis/type III secretory pathway M-ring protein FliF/YscJ
MDRWKRWGEIALGVYAVALVTAMVWFVLWAKKNGAP